MKKGVLTFGLAGILALVLPKAVYSQANVKNEVRRENITARKPVLENIITGQITNTLTGAPVENVNLKFYEYLGNGQVGDLICEYLTGDDGYYNKANAVELVYWGAVKALFRDNPSINFKLQKNLSKTSSSEWAKVEIKGPNHYEAVRYANLGENDRFDFNIIPEDFDMERYKAWCESFGCTQRWGKPEEGHEQPKWYINISPAYYSGVEITPKRWNMAVDFIKNYLPVITNGFVNDPYIEVGTEPPEKRTENWNRVYWRDDMGSGIHVEQVDGNRIYAGAVAFWTRYDPENLEDTKEIYDSFAEEFMQVMGFRGEVPSEEMVLLWDSETREYKQKAKDFGKVLYTRPSGSMSPDIDPAPF